MVWDPSARGSVMTPSSQGDSMAIPGHEGFGGTPTQLAKVPFQSFVTDTQIYPDQPNIALDHSTLIGTEGIRPSWVSSTPFGPSLEHELYPPAIRHGVTSLGVPALLSTSRASTTLSSSTSPQPHPDVQGALREEIAQSIWAHYTSYPEHATQQAPSTSFAYSPLEQATSGPVSVLAPLDGHSSRNRSVTLTPFGQTPTSILPDSTYNEQPNAFITRFLSQKPCDGISDPQSLGRRKRRNDSYAPSEVSDSTSVVSVEDPWRLYAERGTLVRWGRREEVQECLADRSLGIELSKHLVKVFFQAPHLSFPVNGSPVASWSVLISPGYQPRVVLPRVGEGRAAVGSDDASARGTLRLHRSLGCEILGFADSEWGVSRVNSSLTCRSRCLDFPQTRRRMLRKVRKPVNVERPS
jgi:hypothetical protein